MHICLSRRIFIELLEWPFKPLVQVRFQSMRCRIMHYVAIKVSVTFLDFGGSTPKHISLTSCLSSQGKLSQSTNLGNKRFNNCLYIDILHKEVGITDSSGWEGCMDMAGACDHSGTALVGPENRDVLCRRSRRWRMACDVLAIDMIWEQRHEEGQATHAVGGGGGMERGGGGGGGIMGIMVSIFGEIVL